MIPSDAAGGFKGASSLAEIMSAMAAVVADPSVPIVKVLPCSRISGQVSKQVRSKNTLQNCIS